MSTVDHILSYLAAGQATSPALADALKVAETSIARALRHLQIEGRVTTGTIRHQKTGREMTVYRLAAMEPTPA